MISKTVQKMFLALLVLSVFSAVASATTTVRYMTFFPPEIEAEVVAAFEKAHPDIKIEMEAVGFGDIFTKLRTTIAGGVAPDVVSLNLENYTEFAAGGTLAQLDPLILRDSFDLTQYYPRVVDLFRMNGTLFGLPGSFSNVVIFYNQDLYGRAGLDGPEESWGWDDMLSAAKKLTRDTSGDGVADQHGYAVAWWPLYVWLAGGDILDESGTKALIGSAEAARGLQEMVDTWLVHGVAPSPSELAIMGDWDRWATGTLANFPIGPWGLAPFQDTPFDWDAAHHPPMEEQATFLFSNPLAITSQSANLDAAWTFVKFATGPEGSTIRQNAGYEISPIRAVAESHLGRDLARPQNVRVFLEAAAYAISPPAISQWEEVNAIIDEQLNLVRQGQIPAETAMANAASMVQAVLDR